MLKKIKKEKRKSEACTGGFRKQGLDAGNMFTMALRRDMIR